MKVDNGREKTIGVTSFKSKCLAVIDDVAQGRTSRVLLMRHNRPVAAIVPVVDDVFDLWGAMRGTVIVEPETDLTEGTGEVWEAEA